MNNNPFDKTIKAPLWAITLLLLIPVIGIFAYQASMSTTENEVVIETPRSQIVKDNIEKTDPIITEEVKPPVVNENPVKEVPVVEEVKYSKDKSEYTKVEKTVVPTPPSEINEYTVYAVEDSNDNNQDYYLVIENNNRPTLYRKNQSQPEYDKNIYNNLKNEANLKALITLDGNTQELETVNFKDNKIYFTIINKKIEDIGLGNKSSIPVNTELYIYGGQNLEKYSKLPINSRINNISQNGDFISFITIPCHSCGYPPSTGILFNLKIQEYRNISVKNLDKEQGVLGFGNIFNDGKFEYTILPMRDCKEGEITMGDICFKEDSNIYTDTF